MPRAVQPDTTTAPAPGQPPTRRRLISAATALAGGALAAVPALAAPRVSGDLHEQVALAAFRKLDPHRKEAAIGYLQAAVEQATDAATSPDAELLAACTEYQRALAVFAGPYISDEVTDATGEAWQETVDAVIATPYRTPAGLRAKASVALSVLLLNVDDGVNPHWREDAESEEVLAIDVLRGFLGEG